MAEKIDNTREEFKQTRVVLPDGSEALAPDTEVLQGIRQGNWKLPETDLDGNPMEIVLRDSQGTFNIPSSELNNNIEEAFQGEGVTLGSLEDIKREGEAEKKRIIQQAYDDPLSAGALGAVRGATLGLSDVALKAMGYEEAVKNLKEVNPNASLAGDVIGTVGSVLATGGTGALAKVASKTAPAALAKLGAKAGEKAAAKIAAKYGIKEGVKRKALELGIGSAVEGALYSGGRTLVDETLLGDEEANYGKVLEDALTGGVFGGVGGAAIPVLGQALKAGITKGSDLVASPKLWDGVKKTYAQAVRLKGGDPKLVDDLFSVDKVDQERLAKYLDRLSSADEDIATELNQFQMQMDDQLKHSSRIRSEGFANRYLDKPLEEVDEATNALTRVEDDIMTGLSRVENNPEQFEQGTLKMLETIRGQVDKFYQAANLRDYASVLHNTRMQTDDLLKRYRSLESLPEGLSPIQKETKELLDGIRKEVDESLKNYQIFGPAGDSFKLADKLYSGIIEPKSVLEGFGKVSTFKQIFPELLEDEVQLATTTLKEAGFEPRLLAKVLRNPNVTGKQKSIENALKVVTNQMRAAGREVDAFMPDSGITQRIDRINEIVRIARGVQSLESQTGRNLTSTIFGGAVGGMFGGPVGTGVGLAVGTALSNPVQVTKTLMNMEKSIQRYNRGVKSYFKDLSKPAKKLMPIKSGIHPIIYQMNDKKQKEGDKSIIQGVNDGSLFQKMDQRVQAVSMAAPKYAAKMQSQMAIAKQLVENIIPPGIIDETTSKDELINLSGGQIRRINNIMISAFSPTEFVNMLKNNQVSPEMMSTFKQAHPNLYAEMHSEAINTVATSELPRQASLRLQYLFDIPVNTGLANIAQTQTQLYGQAPQDETQAQGQKQALKPRVKGLDNLKLSERTSPISAKFG